MRVFDLAVKDLLQIVRDWKAAFFLLVMPIIFTLLFGFMFSESGEEDPRLPVGFLDRDGEALSDHLLTLLNTSDVVRPVLLEEGETEADGMDLVADDELAAVVVVPEGYAERVLAGEEVSLVTIVDEGSTGGLSAQEAIRGAAARLLGAVEVARLTAQALEAQGRAPGDDFIEGTVAEAVESWQDPPLTVTEAESGVIAAQEESAMGVSSFSHSSPAMMVQFSIAGLIGAAEVLVLERKSGALHRLLTTAIPRSGVILGHFLAMLIMILVQLVLLVGFGQLVLGVNYLQAPLAALVVAVCMALWVAALGLLIGTLAKTQEQVIIFSMLAMFILSGLGGAWMPLEFTPPAFQTVGYLLPSAWAMDGFSNIVIRGLGLDSVLLPAAVMLGYFVFFFGLAVWRFQAERVG